MRSIRTWTGFLESDIISSYVSNESNYHMINKAAIEKMKQGVLIVNTARGALIDSNDLIEGIESGKSAEPHWMW